MTDLQPSLEAVDLPGLNASRIRFIWACRCLFILALIVRIAGVTLRGDWTPPVHELPNEMLQQADLLVHGYGFASVYDPHHSPSTLLAPAYVLYLAFPMMRLAQSNYSTLPLPANIYVMFVVINIVASSLLAPLTAQLAARLAWPHRAAVIAGILMCFCPEGIRAAGMVWDEAFLAIAAALILLFIVGNTYKTTLSYKPSIKLGFFSGLLTLLNPAFLPATFAAWMLGIFLLSPRRLHQLFVHAFLFITFTFVGGAPWHIRNWFFLQPPAYVFVRGSLYMEIWNAVHPMPFVEENGQRVPKPFGARWGTDPMIKSGRELTEQQFFAYCRERAVAWLKAHPAEYVQHINKQIIGFWTGITEAIRWEKPWYKFFIPQGIPALLGITGLILAYRRTEFSSWMALLAVLAVFPLLYYFTNAALRFRHPIDIILYIGMGYFIHRLLPNKKTPQDF